MIKGNMSCTAEEIKGFIDEMIDVRDEIPIALEIKKKYLLDIINDIIKRNSLKEPLLCICLAIGFLLGFYAFSFTLNMQIFDSSCLK